MDAYTAALIHADRAFSAAVDVVIAQGDDWDEELAERQLADEDFYYGDDA